MSTSTLSPSKDYDFKGQCRKARSITAGIIQAPSATPSTEKSSSISLTNELPEHQMPNASFPALLLEEEDSYVAVRGSSSEDEDDFDDGVMSLQTATTARSTDEGMNNGEEDDGTNENSLSQQYDTTMLSEEEGCTKSTPRTINFEIDNASSSEHDSMVTTQRNDDVVDGDDNGGTTPNPVVSMIVDESSSCRFSEPASRAKDVPASAHGDLVRSCLMRHNAPLPNKNVVSSDRGNSNIVTHNLLTNSAIQSNSVDKNWSSVDLGRDSGLLVSSTETLSPASPSKIVEPLFSRNNLSATTTVGTESATSMDHVSSPIRTTTDSNVNDVTSQDGDDDIYGAALFSDVMDSSSASEETEPVLAGPSSTTAIVPYTPSSSLVPFEQDEVGATIEEPANEKFPVVSSPSPLFSSTFESSQSSRTSFSTNHNRGLVNLGNTCYMNSALQMLFSQHQFIEDLYQYDTQAEREKEELTSEEEAQMQPKAAESLNDDNNEEKKSLRKAFLSLAREMKLIPEIFDDSNSSSLPEHSDHNGGYRFRTFSSSSAVNPSNFKSILDEQCCLFEGYQQQDAHEYLSTVLDMLHDEIVDEQKKLRARKRKLPVEAEECVPKANDVDPHVSDNEKEEEVDETTVTKDCIVSQQCGTIAMDESGHKRAHEELDDSNPQQGIRVEETDSSPDTATPNDAPQGLTRRASSFAELSTAGISQLLHDGVSDDDDDMSHKGSSAQIKIPRTNDVKLPAPLLLGGRLAAPPTDVSSSGSTERKVHPVWGYCHPPTALLGVVEESDGYEDVPNDTRDGVQDSDPAEMTNDAPEKITPSEEPGIDAASDASMTPVTASAEEGKVSEESKGKEKESSNENAEKEEEEEICTPIESHFGAKVEVRLTCNSCKYTRTKTESYRYFSLDLTDKDDDDDGDNFGSSSILSPMKSKNSCVEDGLKRFFEPEVIDLKCEKCFSSQATETKEIVRLPRVLLLHFKRFIVEWDRILSRVRYEKNRSLVEFKRELDLRDYYGPSGGDDEEGKESMDDSSDANSTTSKDEAMSSIPSYTLKSIVHHHGYTASCGHYTADGLRFLPDPALSGDKEDESNHSEGEKKEQWMHFNDSYVSNVEDENSLLESSAQASAYMVMYECDE